MAFPVKEITLRELHSQNVKAVTGGVKLRVKEKRRGNVSR